VGMTREIECRNFVFQARAGGGIDTPAASRGRASNGKELIDCLDAFEEGSKLVRVEAQ
jgi:hypothetical protein